MICTCIPRHTYFLDCALESRDQCQMSHRGTFKDPLGKGSSLLAWPQALEVGWVPAPVGGPGPQSPVSSPPQRSHSACGSVAAAWRSSPAAAWDTCSGSSTPIPSQEAAALSSPGKWPRGPAGPRALLAAPQ